MHENHTVEIGRGEEGEQGSDDFDTFPLCLCQPALISFRQPLHTLQLVIPVGVVQIGGANMVGQALQPTGAQHTHQHRCARSGQPGDDNNRVLRRPRLF